MTWIQKLTILGNLLTVILLIVAGINLKKAGKHLEEINKRIKPR